MKLTDKLYFVLFAMAVTGYADAAEFGTKQVPMTDVSGFVYCEVGADCDERTVKVLDVSEDIAPTRLVEANAETVKSTNSGHKHTVSILFGLASSQIKEDSLVQIKAYVAENKNSDQLIYLTGYTDRVGNQHFNKRLASDRALAVKRALIKLGMKPGRIKVSSECCIDSPPDFNPEARKVVMTLSGK